MAIEVVLPIQVSVCTDLWCNIRLSQHVNLHVNLLEHEVPPEKWTLRVHARKHSNGMGFPSLDGFLCNVAPVLTLGDQFVRHVVADDCLFELGGAFVVENVLLGLEARQLQSPD